MPSDSVSRSVSESSIGSGNESNTSDNMLSSSGSTSGIHMRTDNDNSDNVTRFILPSMDGTNPAKVLTMDEITHVMKNIQNMELAHEIALNPEYKLQPYQPPENSLERRVKETMHRAFWQILREDLQKEPPSYDYAIRLLSEIKECFPQILAPNNKRAVDHINEVLDEAFIKQKADKGVLDFRSYANFVLNILKKSCAPARDDALKALEDKDDVVETFRGILEIMQLMKLDMANFLLDFARNDIMAHSVEYEKQKFQEYLEYYKFGFPYTEKWLKRHSGLDAESASLSATQCLYNSYMDLVDWYGPEDEFPELLSIDKQRILKLCQRARRLRTCASLISICAGVPVVLSKPENRSTLAHELLVILNDTKDEAEISKLIEENIWEHIKTHYLTKESQVADIDNETEVLHIQIKQLKHKNNPVRLLMDKRLKTYIRFTLRSKAGIPPPPPGYIDYKEELEAYATSFKRVITYNHSVFGDYLLNLLAKLKASASEPPSTSSAAEI